MIALHWLAGLAFAGASVAQGQPVAAPDAAQKIAACEGQKFEFKAGDDRPTKITLCSEKGAGKEALVRMFESAAAKIQQLEKLPADRKASLVAQLKAKIIEVQAGNALADPTPAITTMPASSLPPPSNSLPTPAYSQLPPLPSPVSPPVVANPAPATAPATAKSTVAAAILTKPRLTFECTTPGELSEGGPCVGFARDTLLTIRAGEAVPGGTSLRFLRRGDVRAEIALGQMRKGQARRFKLPMELCAGVTGSNIEIQVMRRGPGATAVGQMVDRRGPYQLRC
jgi:hypothetical protein